MKTLQLKIALLVLLCVASTAQAGVVLSNHVELSDSSHLVFADGSYQTTAATYFACPVGSTCYTGVPGPIGLTGPAGEKGDPGLNGESVMGPQGQTGPQGLKGDPGATFVPNVSTANFPADTNNVWLTNSSTWVDLTGPVAYTVKHYPSLTHFTYAENIGVTGSSWCKLGLFIDDAPEPACVSSYSGVAGSITFNSVTFQCVALSVQNPDFSQQHTFRIKHISQYCHYGNSAFDTVGVSRFTLVQEYPQ